MKKLYSLIAGLVLFTFCGAVFASTEQERRIEYSLAAINDVTALQVAMGEINGNWYTNVSQPFVGGVANATVDLAWGPALYNAWSYWTDGRGYPLFSSYGSIKKIEAGMNYLDFPMYLSYWREITVSFKQPEVTSSSEIWINGSRAWFDGESWRADISTPWNVTDLTILWGGHGQWILNTSPTFDYGRAIVLSLTDMDSSVTVPSRAFGISYLGELSNPTEQAVFVSGIQYDQTLGADVLVCYNTLYKDYGSFKVMVTLQYYDLNLGNSVQYLSRYLDVTDGMILVPLIDNNGGNLGIPYYTSVRFIYMDPSDSGLYKQQWDNTLYTWPDNGGGGGKG